MLCFSAAHIVITTKEAVFGDAYLLVLVIDGFCVQVILKRAPFTMALINCQSQNFPHAKFIDIILRPAEISEVMWRNHILVLLCNYRELNID